MLRVFCSDKVVHNLGSCDFWWLNWGDRWSTFKNQSFYDAMIRSRIPYFPQSQFNIRRYVELHFLHPFSTKREHCLRVTASKRWLKFVLHCHLLHQDVCRYLNLYPDKDCIWAPEFWFHLSTFHRGGEVVGRRTCIPQNPIFAMQPFQPLFSEADFLTENYDEIFQLLEVGKGSLQLVTIDGME